MMRSMMIVTAVSAGMWLAGSASQAGSGIRAGSTAAGGRCAACPLSCADCALGCELCCGDACALCCGAAVSAVRAEEKPAEAKPVKVTGTLVCAACALSEGKKCANVLQVKEGGKDVKYYLADKGNGEEYHDKVCGGGKLEGVTVTGTVTEKDGKKTSKPSKVDLK